MRPGARMVIRVFIASSSGFVAVSTAGTRSGPGSDLRGSWTPGMGLAGGARLSSLRVSARRTSGRASRLPAGDPSHLDNNEKGGSKGGWETPGSPTCLPCTAKEGDSSGSPKSSCVALELGKGSSKSFGVPASLGVNSSGFGTFSLVRFCTGAFSAARFTVLAPESNKFKWELLSTLPCPQSTFL